jgi:hypothetical protein
MSSTTRGLMSSRATGIDDPPEVAHRPRGMDQPDPESLRAEPLLVLAAEAERRPAPV